MSEPRTPGFSEPRSLVFWAFLGLVLVGVYWRTSKMLELWGDSTSGIIASVVVWVLYGLVVGWLIYHFQLFEHRPVTATIAAVLWGLFVAGGVTSLIGQDLQMLFDKLFGFETSRDWGPAFRAPFTEETMKYLGVVALALIPRVRFGRVLDGVYYGTLSGLGFLVSENIFFSNEQITFGGGTNIGGEIFDVMFTRGIFALPFSHVVFTGIAGAGVGYLMSRRGRPLVGRLAVAAGMFATAAFLHGFNNSPILEDVSFNLFIKGIPTIVIFILVVRWGRREYRGDLSVVAKDLPQISDDDFEHLSTRHRRRKALKSSPDRHQAKRIQHAQLDLLVAADVYGSASPEVASAAAALTSDDPLGN